MHGRGDRDRASLEARANEGARRETILVPYDVAWKALEERSFPGVEGTFIHPFDDHNFIAGHATMGLEILEDAPDTIAVIAGIGGGGLITGVGSAIKALKPEIKVWGAEPETAAPAALSFAKGSPQVFKEWKHSFVDGAGGQSVFPRMWERMKPLVDGYIVVSLEETRNAMRLMAEKARIISEGAGALPLAAALTGKAGQGPIVCVVSGGNIDLKKFCELIEAPRSASVAGVADPGQISSISDPPSRPGSTTPATTRQTPTSGPPAAAVIPGAARA